MRQIKSYHGHTPSMRIVYRNADYFARGLIWRSLKDSPKTLEELIKEGKANGNAITPAPIRKTAAAFLEVGILKSYQDNGRLMLALSVEVRE